MFTFIEGQSALNIFIIIIAEILAMLIAFAMHEYAHAFAAVKCGDLTPKMLGRYTLNPLKHIDPIGFICLFIFNFGWAKPVAINPNNFKSYKKGMFLTSIAGVTVNLIIAIISSLLWVVCLKYFNVGNWASVFLINFFGILTIFNINLFVFNLLPIYPLDGFNVVMSLSKNSSGFLKFNMKYGGLLLIAVIVIFSVPLGMLTGYMIDGLTWLWRLII